MSAWLVSEVHVRAIVTAAKDAGILVIGLPADPQGMGRAMFAENMRSLRHRYDDADSCWTEGKELERGFAFSEVRVAPVALLKACDCYDYQACETDDYERTPVARLVNAVRAYALGQLGMTLERAQASRAYDVAPWGLDEEHAAA
jgi:hypothetical protein